MALAFIICDLKTFPLLLWASILYTKWDSLRKDETTLYHTLKIGWVKKNNTERALSQNLLDYRYSTDMSKCSFTAPPCSKKYVNLHFFTGVYQIKIQQLLRFAVCFGRIVKFIYKIL